ncbi:MAG: outer membrane protein assembly factor BamD [Deltaproteobacteria bacterium]|nr:outer membrane protein assembly factor BamD [Deltaproteobacteria bacterium]
MRHKKNHLLIGFLLGFLFVFLSNGCSTIDRFLGKGVDETDPAELMTQGIERLESGHYSDAVQAFEKIRDRYPYSKFAVTAELKLADALYRTAEYEQAFEAYDQFERLHPRHKEIPYVIYQKGMCYFDQITTTDRDQHQTQKARNEFERLIARFPRDDYANMARKNLRTCYISLAEYEIYVGHYYFKRGYYRAALARYTYVIENYQDMGQYHVALTYISKCKERLAAEERDKDGAKSGKPKSWWKFGT